MKRTRTGKTNTSSKVGIPVCDNVGMEDQRQAAVAQSERLAYCRALIGGAEPKVRNPGDPIPSPLRRVFDEWVESINVGGPRGLCEHLRENSGPQPYGGFPFMPGVLFCLECVIAVTAKMSEPDFSGTIPCAGCNLEAPLCWGSITVGMHTLYYGLCRTCVAEDDFAEA